MKETDNGVKSYIDTSSAFALESIEDGMTLLQFKT